MRASGIVLSLLSTGLAIATPARAASRVAAGHLPWQWSSAPDHYPRVALTAARRHQAWVLRERPSNARRGYPQLTPAELRYELRKGGVRRVVWRKTLPSKRSMPGAAMMVSARRVFVARYGRISTTCTLHAFDAHSGRKLWSVTLRGYGPVAHSRWFNRVQLRLIHGHPTVFGHEGPGTSYIEVRDAATGRLRSHRKLRNRLPKPPLAESLLWEVVNVLRGSRVYRRTVAAFISGHVLRIRSPGVALTRFRQAVRQIDGLRIDRGGYTVHARLQRQANGAYVIVARRR